MYGGLCLDAGCGSGGRYRFNPRCLRHMECIFMDIDYPHREVRSWIAATSTCHYVVASITHPPFREGKFRLVYLFHVLEHVQEWELALIRVLSLLTYGGEAHVAFPGKFSKNARADPDHKHVLDPFRVSRLVRSHGFSISLRCCPGSRLPFPVRKIVNIVNMLLSDEVWIVVHRPRP